MDMSGPPTPPCAKGRPPCSAYVARMDYIRLIAIVGIGVRSDGTTLGRPSQTEEHGCETRHKNESDDGAEQNASKPAPRSISASLYQRIDRTPNDDNSARDKRNVRQGINERVSFPQGSVTIRTGNH